MSEELCWFNNYAVTIDMSNLPQLNDYVNKLSNKNDEKNVETKINQIEKDYQNKLSEIEILCNSPDQISELNKKSSLLILQKELDIIKLLTKYTLQNKLVNYDFFMSCLNLLYDLSENLRKRLSQKEIIHEKTQKHPTDDDFPILRCSYKFCSYQDGCTYNYNLQTKNLCYQDHYVHNMVSADLKILLEYIKFKYGSNKTIMHNKEILKTINTLSFVISHMELELRTKCLYLAENEWETCHVVKNK
jgi:hypothetical protein